MFLNDDSSEDEQKPTQQSTQNNGYNNQQQQQNQQIKNQQDDLEVLDLDDPGELQINQTNQLLQQNQTQGQGQEEQQARKQVQKRMSLKEKMALKSKNLQSNMEGRVEKENDFQMQNTNQFVQEQNNPNMVYQNINFQNVIEGNVQHEPGMQYQQENHLPTIQAPNTKFQYNNADEIERDNLKLSDSESDHAGQQLQQNQLQQQPDNQTDIIKGFSDDDEDSENEPPIASVRQESKPQQQQEEMTSTAQGKQEEDDEDEDNDDADQPIEEQKQQAQKIIARPRDHIEFGNKRDFLTKPVEKGLLLQCTIKRDKSGLNHFYPRYHLYLSTSVVHLMSGRKRSGMKTSNYLIGMDKNKLEKKHEGFLGKVRSNFIGTEFCVYDTGLNPGDTKDHSKIRKELAVVTYESNIMGAKGPRKMKTLIPSIDDNGQPFTWKPIQQNESMLDKFKNKDQSKMNFYYNKPPKWNENVQAFVLNFNGRVEKPSVKNFQLVDEYDDETIILQFGRIGDDMFNMDVQYPMSPLQAFGICLSSFDYKIACE